MVHNGRTFGCTHFSLVLLPDSCHSSFSISFARDVSLLVARCLVFGRDPGGSASLLTQMHCLERYRPPFFVARKFRRLAIRRVSCIA